MTKQVYAYVRVSTDTQVEKGYGIPMQLEELRILCRLKNLELPEDHIYIEEGKSGTIPLYRNENGIFYSKREKLAELMNTAAGQIVLIYDASRLARDPDVFGGISVFFKDTKTTLISAKEPDFNIYTTDPAQIIMNSVRSGMAGAERVRGNSRMADGRKARATSGHKSCGRTPYGYKYARNPDTGRVECVIIVPEEAEIVRKIYDWAQTRTPTQIVEKLNKSGARTRKGNEWTVPGLMVIIRNDFYKGWVTYAGRKYPGKHEPLVDEQMWKKAQ